MAAKSVLSRISILGGAIVFLAGQAYDIYWHSQHLTLAVPGVAHLLTVHLGILLGPLLSLGGGLVAVAIRPRRPAVFGGGLLAAVGAVIQLTGFFLVMWAFVHGYDKDLYENIQWYGLFAVVPGGLLAEASFRFARDQESRATASEANRGPSVPARGDS
jgi:hypothetical protein